MKQIDKFSNIPPKKMKIFLKFSKNISKNLVKFEHENKTAPNVLTQPDSDHTGTV